MYSAHGSFEVKSLYKQTTEVNERRFNVFWGYCGLRRWWSWIVELEEANAKQVEEVKASAEALELSKKELEKVSASREVIPAKEDVLESKKELIKDELGEAILATFEMSGLRNKK